MSKITAKPENAFGESADIFLRKKGKLYEGGHPIVQNEWVQDYLDEFIPIKSAILDEAEAKGQDPELIEMIHRFLNLTDERNEDGSIERSMLSYHIRVAHRISLHFMLFSGPEEIELMKVLIGLNFNKPPVLDYYYWKIVPKLVAAGSIPAPYPSVQEMILWWEKHEAMIHSLIPGEVTSYDPQGINLADCIWAAASRK